MLHSSNINPTSLFLIGKFIFLFFSRRMKADIFKVILSYKKVLLYSTMYLQTVVFVWFQILCNFWKKFTGCILTKKKSCYYHGRWKVHDYFSFLLCKSSIWFTEKDIFKTIIYSFNTSKCVANYVISFEVVGWFHSSKDFEAMKAGKLAIRPWLSCPYIENALVDFPSSVAATDVFVFLDLQCQMTIIVVVVSMHETCCQW